MLAYKSSSYYGRSGRVYPTPEDTSCLGICAGSFAAAAVSVSKSLLELIPAAIEAVMIAFRTSMASLTMRDDIVGLDRGHESCWSVVVSGEEQELQRKLDEFSETEVCCSLISSPESLS